MKVTITDDPRKSFVRDGYKKKNEDGTETFIEGECCIMRDDVEGAKEFARQLLKEPNAKVRQQWEKDYYHMMKERYSAQVAGALLMKVWDWAPSPEAEVKKPESNRTWGTEELSTVAKKILEKINNETVR